MKFGLFFFAENPEEFRTPDTENYQQALELTELAEDLGYDQVWTAEHHFDAQYPPNPFILCAAMAARTSRIRIGDEYQHSAAAPSADHCGERGDGGRAVEGTF